MAEHVSMRPLCPALLLPLQALQAAEAQRMREAQQARTIRGKASTCCTFLHPALQVPPLPLPGVMKGPPRGGRPMELLRYGALMS